MKDNTVNTDALRIMIAGPMTGYEDFNRPLFNQVADELCERGFIVYNPATLPDGLSHDEYLAVTLGWVDEVDGLFMLDGWGRSKGAVREFDRMMRRCIPVLHFQSLDAFRAALTRSRVLAGALVSRRAGHHDVSRYGRDGMTKKTVCRVEGNKIATRCETLQRALEYGNPTARGKGLFIPERINIKTGSTGRDIAQLHSGEFVGCGAAMFFCPFCGASLKTWENM